VDVELALAGSVWQWTRQHCPDDPRVAEKAVTVALSSYVGGASVAEACEQARSFVVSWVRHPACTKVAYRGRLGLAS
jgi:formylglycine-generating enzyme required for sulfatase activity